MNTVDPLKMIHDIRKKIYNETKDLSSAEYLNYINLKAKKVTRNRKQKKYKNLNDFYKALTGKQKKIA